eukprot:1966658-Prymnesium_polylepis.1
MSLWSIPVVYSGESRQTCKTPVARTLWTGPLDGTSGPACASCVLTSVLRPHRHRLPTPAVPLPGSPSLAHASRPSVRQRAVQQGRAAARTRAAARQH